MDWMDGGGGGYTVARHKHRLIYLRHVSSKSCRKVAESMFVGDFWGWVRGGLF